MSAPHRIELVVAATTSWGIGVNGGLPWRLKFEDLHATVHCASADMAHFKAVTSTTSKPGMRNAVVMGRRTWESLPARFRPLPGRLNIVLTSSSAELMLTSSSAQLLGTEPDERPLATGSEHAPPFDVLIRVVTNFEAALVIAGDPQNRIERVFVIGGGAVYATALAHPACHTIHLTRVHAPATLVCDTFMPALDGLPFAAAVTAEKAPMHIEDGLEYEFVTLVRSA